MIYLALEGLDGRYVGIGFSGVFLIVFLALIVCLAAYLFLKKRVARKTILVLLLLFLVGYGARLFILLRNPLIYGIDGPWYVKQVGTIVETGVPSEAGLEPIVMYLTSGASVFVNDVTLGIKITQAFFSALLLLTIWLLTFYITKNNLASFVAALLMAFFILSVGMSDVLRNSGALAFLPLFYLFFFKFINGEARVGDKSPENPRKEVWSDAEHKSHTFSSNLPCDPGLPLSNGRVRHHDRDSIRGFLHGL